MSAPPARGGPGAHSRLRLRLRRVGDVAVVVLALMMDLVAAGPEGIGGGQIAPILFVLATAAVYATLLLRWRHPIVIFCVQWCFTWTTMIEVWFQPFAALLIALHAVAARLSARWSVLALLATLVPFSLYSARTADVGGTVVPRAFAEVMVLWMLLATATWAVGRLSYVSARRSLRLHELQVAEAAAAVQAERMRLARELHDIVAHTVTIMMIQATGAKAVLEPGQPDVRKALEVIEDSGVQAMAELHRMLNLLRMPDGEDEPGALQPDLRDLQHLVGAAAQAGRDVSLEEVGTPGTLDPSVSGAAYRVVQEALTNAAKHGGPQAIVRVRLAWTESALEVSVTDRERGPKLSAEQAAALSSGHGLRGLRERVIMVGGALEAGPVDGGFRVRAILPRHGVRAGSLLASGQAG
ncbi:sensor histidine kinase [Microlunatus ginsengisoli]|uniref:histidine kinase n=1 Tax=Microlunatus ginsengisoli TaxID=363863 RepID=A0ABP6ZXV0_9ACTN